MTAAIFTSIGVIAAVALYGLHVWREVRLAQTAANRAVASVDPRIESLLRQATDALEEVRYRFPGPPLKSDNLVRPEFGHRKPDDPTGGDAA